MQALEFTNLKFCCNAQKGVYYLCFMTSIVNCAKGTEFPQQRRQQRSALAWGRQPHGKNEGLIQTQHRRKR
nr:MAG TPA: hypothetical protein [Caudoviricetes sp.]